MTPAMATRSCQQSCRITAWPSWLQATLAELDEKFRSLGLASMGGDELESESESESHSFADRAENYYRIRPQLLSLLQELYYCYLTLADRYAQALAKSHAHKLDCSALSEISTVHSDNDDPDDGASSEAESSLSFQLPPPAADQLRRPSSADDFVVELVSRTVEKELLLHEVGFLEKLQSESTRKVELQGSLLEVLESERMVLLTENARLGYQAAAVAEENEGLAAEVGYMRKKAGDMARCVLKLSEEHRACMLGRKIERLQAQICGLEKRNRECYEAMARREDDRAELLRGVCMELERVKAQNARLRDEAEKRNHLRRSSAGHGRVARWWSRATRLEWAVCGSDLGAEDGG